MGVQVNFNDVVETLGGAAALGRRVVDQEDLLRIVEDGVPKSALDAFMSRLSQCSHVNPLGPFVQLFEDEYLQDSSASELSVEAGRALVRIARLFVLLCDSLDDNVAAVRFLTTKHPELGNEKPIEKAMSETGVQEIERVVMRGRHGLPV